MLRFSAFVLTLCLAVGAAQAQTPRPVAPVADDPVVARVDGQPIRRSEVIAFQRALPPQFQQVSLEALLEPIVDRLVSQKLIAAEGRRANLQNDAEVKARLQQFEERVMQETLLNRMLENKLTDAALQARYAEYQKENPGRDEIRARHILVANEQAAVGIIGELGRGGDFAKIASDRSVDPAGKQSGGDLGFFGKDDMVPEFWAAASTLKAGETTKAPVRSQFGWHVIRVEERRVVPESFDDLREKLASDMSQEIMNGFVEGLVKKAKVERFAIDGKPLPKAP